MQGLVNISSDYGSHAVSFSPIATTDGLSPKSQPLLKLHIHLARAYTPPFSEL